MNHMIPFVILLQWRDDRECTAEQLQWNDVYSRQAGDE